MSVFNPADFAPSGDVTLDYLQTYYTTTTVLDSQISALMPKAGGTFTGDVVMGDDFKLAKASNQLVIQPSGAGNTTTVTAATPASNRVFTIPDIATSTFVMTSGAQTLADKTIANPTISSPSISGNTTITNLLATGDVLIASGTPYLKLGADDTDYIRLEPITLPVAATTLQLPISTDVLVGRATTDTLTNKTLTTPTLTGLTTAGTINFTSSDNGTSQTVFASSYNTNFTGTGVPAAIAVTAIVGTFNSNLTQGDTLIVAMGTVPAGTYTMTFSSIMDAAGATVTTLAASLAGGAYSTIATYSSAVPGGAQGYMDRSFRFVNNTSQSVDFRWTATTGIFMGVGGGINLTRVF